MSQIKQPYAAVAVVEGGKSFRYFKDADAFFCVIVDCDDADTVEARTWLSGFIGAVDGPSIEPLLVLCRLHYKQALADGLVGA